MTRNIRLPTLLLIGLFFSSAFAAEHDKSNSWSDQRLRVVCGIEFVVDKSLPMEQIVELARAFEAVQQQLVDELDVPPIEVPIRIYLFERQKDFSRYVMENVPSVNYNATLGRHGLFLLRQGRPYVFLVKSDDLVECLRHESVHVVLNSTHPNLPIWIDEGLAQCYESSGGRHWCERSARVLSKDLMRRSPPTTLSLARINLMSQMGVREYAGSWANVCFLLNDQAAGRPALRAYLSELRRGDQNPTLTVQVPPLNRLQFSDK